MKCHNLFITSVFQKVKSERSSPKVKIFGKWQKKKIQKSKSILNFRISQSSNPLEISQTCCKVQMFLKSEKFCKRSKYVFFKVSPIKFFLKVSKFFQRSKVFKFTIEVF